MLQCIVSIAVPFIHNHGKAETIDLVNILWRPWGDRRQRGSSGLLARGEENIKVRFPQGGNVCTKIRSFLLPTPTLPQALSLSLFSGAMTNIWNCVLFINMSFLALTLLEKTFLKQMLRWSWLFLIWEPWKYFFICVLFKNFVLFTFSFYTSHCLRLLANTSNP